MTVCTACKSGTFSDVAKSSCGDCGLGTFGSRSGSCEQCSPGTFSELERGADRCEPCEDGKFQDSTGESACDACPRGKFAMGVGFTICDDCADGTFANETGLSACYECEEGKFSDFSTGLSTCEACGPGKFSSGRGCVLCGEGSYSPSSGLTECDACAPGKFQDNTGESACETCPEGTFVGLFGATRCSACAAGTFGELMGLTACEECPEGTFARDGGLSRCELCPAGEFGATTGLTACEECPEGVSSEAGATGCGDGECPRGTFGSSGGGCEPCPVGSVTNRTGLSACFECAAGTFSSAEGTVCVKCASGMFQAEGGQSDCDVCSDGKFAASSGLSVCTDCAAGKFQSVFGSTDCLECPAGTFAGLDGLSRCETCAPGSFALAGWSSCDACAPGSFAPAYGGSACVSCADGTVSSDDRASCTTCGRGSEANAAMTECVACAAGTFSADAGSCIDCAAGTYAGATGLSTCEACLPGKFARSGATRCTDCAIGKFSSVSASSGEGECQQCAQGTVANTTGLSSCFECQAGKFAASGMTSCTVCSIGKFSAAPGLSSCLDCPAGKFAEQKGATECASRGKGANPRIDKIGAVSLSASPPVIGEPTEISVVVTNNGDSDASSIVVALSSTGWGLAWGGWELIANLEVDVPAGGRVEIAHTHVFETRERVSIAAEIQEPQGPSNLHVDDDLGLFNTEVVFSGPVLSLTLPLINNAETSIDIGNFRILCLDPETWDKLECSALDEVKLSAPASDINDGGAVTVPAQSEIAAEILANVSEAVMLVVEAEDLATGEQTHVVLSIEPATVEGLLNFPHLCCVESVRTRVMLEKLLAEVLMEYEKGEIEAALKLLRKFFSHVLLLECDAEEKECFERAMEAMVEVARLMGTHRGVLAQQGRVLVDADLMERNGLYEAATRLYLEKAKTDPGPFSVEDFRVEQRTDYEQLML